MMARPFRITSRGFPDCVTWTELLKLLLCNIFRISYVEYVLCSLFYQTLVSGVYRQAAISISFLASVIASVFALRILYINEEKRTKTILVVVILCVINHHYFLYAPWNDRIVFNFMFDIFTLIYILFLIPPLLLQIFVFEYAAKCKIAELRNNVEDCVRYKRLMERADLDASFMSAMDCYLRAAVQQVVQLAIFFHNHGDFTQIAVVQQISIIISLAFMPWFITSFHGTMVVHQHKATVSWKAKIVSYLGNLHILVSRIISISCAAAFWPMTTGVILFIHYVGAVIWIWTQTKPTAFFCDNNFCHLFFCLVFGEFFIFRPINLGERSSYIRYIIFHAIALMENVVAVVVWICSENESKIVYRIIVSFVSWFCFFVGIALMALYYAKFHPKSRENTAEDNDDSLGLGSSNTG